MEWVLEDNNQTRQLYLCNFLYNEVIKCVKYRVLKFKI